MLERPWQPAPATHLRLHTRVPAVVTRGPYVVSDDGRLYTWAYLRAIRRNMLGRLQAHASKQGVYFDVDFIACQQTVRHQRRPHNPLPG